MDHFPSKFKAALLLYPHMTHLLSRRGKFSQEQDAGSWARAFASMAVLQLEKHLDSLS